MRYLLIITLLITILSGCNQQSSNTESDSSALDDVMSQVSTEKINEVKVLEFANAGAYTYVKLDDNGKVFWGAITARPVEIGKTYVYKPSLMMRNFPSKQLGKTFDSVMFIQDFSDAQAVHESAIARSEPQAHTKTAPQSGISVEPAKDGKSVAQIYADKNSLNGKKVTVRGKVVKISENIMNRHWIHIQDGTESDGNFDLTVTTDMPLDFRVGDVVTFSGILAADKDFGAGYKYAAIVEGASWTNSADL